MAHSLRKIDIVRVLRDANVDFDPEGTVAQLRPLYDQVLANLGPAATENNNIPAVQGNLDGNEEQRPEAPMQNQQQQQQQHENSDANRVQQERPAAPNENDAQRQNQQNNQQQNIQGDVGNANEPWARQMAQEEAEIERKLALLRKKRELIELQK